MISVIVPVRNGERCVANVLESLARQSDKDFQLLIVDNGSTDRTAEIARRYGTVVSEPKAGLSNARNAGIAVAEGSILAFTDADCEADPHWVATIRDHFQNHPEDSVVTGETRIPQAGYVADAISALGFPGGGAVGFERMWRVDASGYTTKFTGCNFAFRRTVLDDVGLFDTRLKRANDDSEMSVRLIRHGHRIRFLPNLIIHHEPRGRILAFMKWHLGRGRSNYHFKTIVGSVGPFVRLRLWSSWNILKHFGGDPKIVLIIPLLGLSFIMQQLGFILEKARCKLNATGSG